MNNKSLKILSFILLATGAASFILLFAGLVIKYSNPTYNRGFSISSFKEFGIFFLCFAITLAGTSIKKKSEDKSWSIIKQNNSSNLVGFGFLALAIFLYIFSYPLETMGEWHYVPWVILISLSTISFLFLSSTGADPVKLRQTLTPTELENEISRIRKLKNIFRAISTFILGSIVLLIAWLVIIVIFFPPGGMAGIGIAVYIFIVIPAGIFIGGIPFIIYHHFRDNEAKLSGHVGNPNLNPNSNLPG